MVLHTLVVPHLTADCADLLVVPTSLLESLQARRSGHWLSAQSRGPPKRSGHGRRRCRPRCGGRDRLPRPGLHLLPRGHAVARHLGGSRLDAAPVLSRISADDFDKAHRDRAVGRDRDPSVPGLGDVVDRVRDHRPTGAQPVGRGRPAVSPKARPRHRRRQRACRSGRRPIPRRRIRPGCCGTAPASTRWPLRSCRYAGRSRRAGRRPVGIARSYLHRESAEDDELTRQHEVDTRPTSPIARRCAKHAHSEALVRVSSLPAPNMMLCGTPVVADGARGLIGAVAAYRAYGVPTARPRRARLRISS